MKDDLLYLIHMVEHAAKVRQRVEGLLRSDFDHDENLRLALAHLIQIIGEAARQVSQESRHDTPQVPWQLVTGMRHRIVHDYVNINYDIVWETATRSIPQLLALLEPYVLQRRQRAGRGHS
jgi:uncharacterized protein with HEPN domain